MMVDLAGDEATLLQRIGNATVRGCVFLFGAALVAPATDDGPGVPGVDGVVKMIRRRYTQPDDLAKLDEHLRVGTDNRYQAAFAHLHRTHGPDEVGRVIREAVLCARKSKDSDIADAVVRGEERACRELENDLTGWHLSAPVESIGQIAAAFPETFGRYVLTTNFDPLIETAIRRAGGAALRSALHSDGRFTNVDAPGCHVVHLHGDWFRSDTLHTPVQLLQDRPLLTGSLRRLLRTQTLVAIGYGGWDDVLTRALAEIVREDDSQFDILWAFYDRDADAIVKRYGALINSLRPGEARGRVTYYAGIDLTHTLPALWKRLASSRSTRAVSGTTRATVAPALDNGDSLLQAVVERDPLISLTAAAELALRPELLPRVIECRSSELVPLTAIKRVLAAHPGPAAELAVPVILESPWSAALAVSSYLGSGLRPFAADRLGKAINRSEVDRTRVIINGLGHLAAKDWAFAFSPLIEDKGYYTEKYVSFVVEALTFMFVDAEVTSFRDEASAIGDRLKDALEAGIAKWKHLSNVFGLGDRLVLRMCRGAQADVLVRDWLPSPTIDIRHIAVDALGDARIARSVPALRIAADRDPADTVSNGAILALGTIATRKAIEALLELGVERTRAGLLMCITELPDRAVSEQLIEHTLGQPGGHFMRWAALRAIGVFGDSSRADVLREELTGSSSLERGAAALALARVEGPRAYDAVHRAWLEGSDPLERIFSGLALILADPDSWNRVSPQLRQDLAAEHPLPPLAATAARHRRRADNDDRGGGPARRRLADFPTACQ